MVDARIDENSLFFADPNLHGFLFLILLSAASEREELEREFDIISGIYRVRC